MKRVTRQLVEKCFSLLDRIGGPWLVCFFVDNPRFKFDGIDVDPIFFFLGNLKNTRSETSRRHPSSRTTVARVFIVAHFGELRRSEEISLRIERLLLIADDYFLDLRSDASLKAHLVQTSRCRSSTAQPFA